ncbi:GNAT family protein [Seiridium cupressi]
MKRAKSQNSSDAGADPSTTASPSPSSTNITSTKRRRNNPEECCVTCKLRKASLVSLPAFEQSSKNYPEWHRYRGRDAAEACPTSAATTPTPQAVTTSEEDSAPESRNDTQTPTALDSALVLSPSCQDHLLKREVILKHADVYFEQLFHMPCMGFLHAPTIYRLIEEDKLSPALAAGICSITADFVSPGAAGCALALRCNEQVEFFILRNSAFMSRDYLVYHLLATLYNWMSGPLSKVWMLTATASRLIKCLQLNYEPDLRPTQETYPEREIQRRSVWQIYIIDHFLSGGHDEHLLLPSSSIHIRLPCSDQVFRDGLPSAMETLDKNPSIPSNVGDYSLDACHVRLLTIRSQVLRATKRFTDSSQGQMLDPMRPEQFMEHVNQYQTALYRFSDTLPEHLKLSVLNVDAHVHRPDRPSFTMLHTWYCQTHIELYSFSLHALKRSTTQDSVPWEFFLRSHQDFLLRSQQQAVSYAICLAQTWDYSHQHIANTPSTSLKSGLVTVDWMIGACAVDVMEVLLAARRYRLYENLRGNTSAQMCFSKTIDDDLLAHLISNVMKIVGDLAAYLPRVEHYRNVIKDKLKEFEDDFNGDSHQGSVKGEEQGVTSSPTNLPGMDNVIPQTGYLQKKSTSSYEKSMSLNGVSHIGDLPVIPYCLRQAQDSSSEGPFAPPTAGDFPPPRIVDSPTHQTFDASMAPNLGPVFDTTFRSALPVDSSLHGPIAYGHCTIPPDSPQVGMPTQMPPYHTDTSAFISPVSSYAFHNEQPQATWIQHGQRMPHAYS